MKTLILTGPPGSGKNTIANLYAKSRERCAIIDVDTVRQMLVKPHKAPWDGEEGKRQQLLGVKNACQLAKNFSSEGADVVILDVLSNESAQMYKKELGRLKIILLLPTFDEIKMRNNSRTKYLTDEEIEMLYQTQLTLSVFDTKIDNTHLTAEEVAMNLR